MMRPKDGSAIQNHPSTTAQGAKDLSSQSMIPLYYQLKELLRSDIESRRYEPGDMLPAVSSLMAEHGVSRHVVMRALSELGAEGMIVSRKGVGSFVNHSKLKKTIDFVEGFTSSLMQLSGSTHTKVLSKRFIDLPEDVKIALEIPGARKGFSLTRAGYVGNEPIVMVENFYPRQIGEVLSRHALENTSTYELLRRLTPLESTSAHKTMSVTFATLGQATVLGVKEGFALVCIRSLTRDQHSRPFDYSEIYYRSDRVEFSFANVTDHA